MHTCHKHIQVWGYTNRHVHVPCAHTYMYTTCTVVCCGYTWNTLTCANINGSTEHICIYVCKYTMNHIWSPTNTYPYAQTYPSHFYMELNAKACLVCIHFCECVQYTHVCIYAFLQASMTTPPASLYFDWYRWYLVFTGRNLSPERPEGLAWILQSFLAVQGRHFQFIIDTTTPLVLLCHKSP